MRYKIPKGSPIRRHHRPLTATDNGHWESFITQKDAYYDDDDYVNEVSYRDVSYVYFDIPAKDYDQIAVSTDYVVYV